MVNNEGIPIKSTLDSTSTVQYSAEVSQLAERAKCLVRDLDPTNELTFVRIASRRRTICFIQPEHRDVKYTDTTYQIH